MNKRVGWILTVTLVLFELPPTVTAQAPQVPEWVQSIKPADYALLAADLDAGFAFREEITSGPNNPEIDFTDDQGRTRTKRVESFVLRQLIDVKAKPDPDKPTILIKVFVFSTPEECIAFCRKHFDHKAGRWHVGLNPDWMINANELGDARLNDNGGSVNPGRSATIRYRNMVANFLWCGFPREETTQKCAQAARLWLDKVARQPPPVGANLRLTPENIWIKHWQNYDRREREPAADRQYVMATIANVSPDVTAQNVRARISVQMPGAAQYTPIGDPQIVGSIAPGESAYPIFEWNLQGESVIRAALLIEAWSEGAQDADPNDNQAGLEVSIYYAYNGDNAFRWHDDSYCFRNYRLSESDTAELVAGLLATVVGEVYTDVNTVDLLNRMFFPQTYKNFLEYMQKSMRAGAGGHCYGMAATAGLYFMDGALRPIAKDTRALTQAEADANIKLYQRAQMVPIAQAMIGGQLYLSREWGGVKTLDTVRSILRDERRPVILSIAGTRKVEEEVMVNDQPQQQMVDKMWGHAVLAYKLVDITGRDSIVYVYDPNLPPNHSWSENTPMSAISISPENGGLATTSDMTPLYRRETNDPNGEITMKWIAARAVTREISLAEANLIVPALRAKFKEMTDTLDRINKFMAVLRCPADLVFTDQQGRRVGQIGDIQVNEIPGAEIETGGEVEIYLLPADREYSMTITGTDSGSAALDIIRPASGETTLTSFQNMPVRAGSTMSAKVATGADISTISGDGLKHLPTFNGSVTGVLELEQPPEKSTVSVPPKIDGSKLDKPDERTPPTTHAGPETTQIAPDIRLNLLNNSVRPGERIAVVHSDFPISAKNAWIGFYDSFTARDQDYLSYTFLANLNNRTYDVIAPSQPGNQYHFRIFPTEGYNGSVRSTPVEVK